MEQPVFEGFEEIEKYSRFKEKSTRQFIESFFAEHLETPQARDYANSLICIAYNIDRYNASVTPKNISTLMDSYNSTMQSLRDLYPETQELSDDLANLLKAASA
ncbi:MAG: hypothetical protein MR570_04580 [Bifidobacterium pseudolongum]|nr:hypothetical protein [Bifidobacterium pseudolongum]